MDSNSNKIEGHSSFTHARSAFPRNAFLLNIFDTYVG